MIQNNYNNLYGYHFLPQKRRRNDNLEQQAQALFKFWFVDFEPFKDGKFVDSELGMIPEGWKTETIKNLCEVISSGGTPKSLNLDYYSGNINWFTTKELKDCFLFDSEKHISNEALNNSSAKLFPKDSVLLAIYASPTVGRLGVLSCDSTFNQAAVGMVPIDSIGMPYLFLQLLSERQNLNNLAIGAAQQNLNVQTVKNYLVICPMLKVLNEFNNVVKPIFDLICKHQKQNINLSTIRDTLLPKLMSGELKISDLNN